MDLPRKIAKKISRGKIKPRFIGKKNDIVLFYEFASFIMSFKPNTMTKDEKLETIEKINTMIDEWRSSGFPTHIIVNRITRMQMLIDMIK